MTTASPRDPVRLLLGTYLFGDLTPTAVRPLADRLAIRRYRRGEYVCRAGEPSVALFIVVDGQLREVVLTAQGEELLTELYSTGDIFGEPGLFSRDRARVVSIAAMQDSEVASVGREILIAFLKKHPPAMMRMLQGLAEYVRADMHELANIAFRQIRERLALLLLELADSTAHTDATVRLSQTTLAAMIAATRENVNRAMADLVADGYVAVNGRSLTIIDSQGLQRLAAAAAPALPPANRFGYLRP
jgi:CRP/FNR family transcriptional regulator